MGMDNFMILLRIGPWVRLLEFIGSISTQWQVLTSNRFSHFFFLKKLFTKKYLTLFLPHLRR